MSEQLDNRITNNATVKNADTSEKYDDSFLFVISCFLLRFFRDNHVVLWVNQRPSSNSSCRPIKLQFKPETEDVVGEEESKVREQINQLTPTAVCVDAPHSNMIDGKLGNYIGNTSKTLFDLQTQSKSSDQSGQPFSEKC